MITDDPGTPGNGHFENNFAFSFERRGREASLEVPAIDLCRRSTAIMAELQGTSRTNFARDVLTVNVGLRQKLTETCILITSLGHEMRGPDDQALAMIGYFGVQLLY